MSHTPGPWSVNHYAEDTQDYQAWVGNRDQEFAVADVLHDYDARLIAAAPDLLEALEARHLHGDVRYNGCDACAAIAKAKGS